MGYSSKGNLSLRHQSQIGSSLHWTLLHSCQTRRSCLPIGTTSTPLQSPRCLPRSSTQVLLLISYLGVDHETLDLQDNLTYREYPVRILDPDELPLDVRISSFSRFNGHTIPTKKPHGKGRIVFDLSTPPSSRRILNLETRFF